jgi:hypothetical protein
MEVTFPNLSNRKPKRQNPNPRSWKRKGGVVGIKTKLGGGRYK